ncbi:type III-B CRISPR module-associated Cmr3 family protein [Sulfolobus tengchongensis]|uniref:Type III-B CRISPR module-associated Cmr3 family protein n=1 Tax=Sulfolobus tengchongensis TaxID=207809 RepID=A0AAX4L1V0_9CREN
MNTPTFVCIKPIESYLFRMHGEFDVNLKGPYSTASSIELPLPSTIAGILSTINIEDNKVKIEENKEEDVFDQNYTLQGKIWGPIIRKGDKIGVLNGEYTKNGELIITEKEVRRERRVGIGMEADRRVTKEGMIFTTTLVDLNDIGEICYYYEGEIKGERVIKFGGEGRVALLKSSQVELNCVKSKLAYLLSPLLIKSEVNINTGIIEFDNGVSLSVISGRFYSVGLGFNVRTRKRKPIYKALMQDSIVKLNREIGCFESIGEYSQLGYGSLLPVNKVIIKS